MKQKLFLGTGLVFFALASISSPMFIDSTILMYVFGSLGSLFFILLAFQYFSPRAVLYVPFALAVLFFFIGWVIDDFSSMFIYYPVGILSFLVGIGLAILNIVSPQSPISADLNDNSLGSKILHGTALKILIMVIIVLFVIFSGY